jgi:hypothetical protein
MQLARLNNIGGITVSIADSIVLYRGVLGACTHTMKTLQ